MDIDKPLPKGVSAYHLLGAVGMGHMGFRIGHSKDHLDSEEIRQFRLGAASVTETMRKYARNDSLRRPNPRHPEQIDEFILRLMIQATKDLDRTKSTSTPFVRREAIAHFLNVPEHFVSQALERLNKRGFVGPENNEGAHDTNRGGCYGGSESGWSGSIRYAVMERVREEMALRQAGAAQDAIPGRSHQPRP